MWQVWKAFQMWELQIGQVKTFYYSITVSVTGSNYSLCFCLFFPLFFPCIHSLPSFVSYCSKECQVGHWKKHKVDCKKKEKKKKQQEEQQQQEEQKPEGSIFVPGSKWCIRNLTSEKGQVLNGQIATVVSYKTGKTRVYVTADGKNFNIMPDNLIPLEQARIVQKDTETSHPTPQVDALEWLPGSQSHGQFLGICFKDSIRYKCTYYSTAEKAHIECSELADHGFFTEAGVRLPWVNGRRPEGRNLIRRVQEGLDAISGKFDHETPLESFQRKSKNCVEMIQDFDEDTANKGFEKLTALIEERERVIVPQFDFFERTGGHGIYKYTINKEWSHYQEGWKGVEETWNGETTYGGCGNIMDAAGMAVTQKSGLIQGTLCKESPVYYQTAEQPPYEAPACFEITIRSRDHVFDDKSDLVFGEITIPHADIDKFEGHICKPSWQCEWSMAPNEMLLQTAQNWLMIPQAFQLAGRDITDTDQFADKIQMICSALVERTEFNLAIKVARSLLPFDLTANGYGPGWFLCMLAECSEVVGNRKQAFTYYKRIETLDAISLKSKYPDDTYGCEGNNMEREFAKVYVKLPEGTLEERLERTHQALSAPDYDTGGRRRSRPYAGTPIVQEREQKKSTQKKKKEKKKKQ